LVATRDPSFSHAPRVCARSGAHSLPSGTTSRTTAVFLSLSLSRIGAFCHYLKPSRTRTGLSRTSDQKSVASMRLSMWRRRLAGSTTRVLSRCLVVSPMHFKKKFCITLSMTRAAGRGAGRMKLRPRENSNYMLHWAGSAGWRAEGVEGSQRAVDIIIIGGFLTPS
jgi:hypothetical protein